MFTSDSDSWFCIIYITFFFLMIRRPPRSTRTDTLFPYTTLFRSGREYGRSVCSYGLHQNNDFAALLRRAPAQPKFEQAIVHTHCFGHGVDAVFEAGKHVIEIAAALVRRVELDAKRHRSIHRLQTCGLGQYQAIGPILLCSAALARPVAVRAVRL